VFHVGFAKNKNNTCHLWLDLQLIVPLQVGQYDTIVKLNCLKYYDFL